MKKVTLRKIEENARKTEFNHTDVSSYEMLETTFSPDGVLYYFLNSRNGRKQITRSEAAALLLKNK